MFNLTNEQPARLHSIHQPAFCVLLRDKSGPRTMMKNRISELEDKEQSVDSALLGKSLMELQVEHSNVIT